MAQFFLKRALSLRLALIRRFLFQFSPRFLCLEIFTVGRNPDKEPRLSRTQKQSPA
jgi:hypothetical protein